MVQRLRVNYEPVKGRNAKPIHWPTRLPFLAASDKWNPDLPKAPGHHGAIFRREVDFYTDDDGHQAQLDSVNCFARRGSNSWEYLGLYKAEGHAVLSKEQYRTLSKTVRQARAKGIMASIWGRKWIADANAQIDKRNEEITNRNLDLALDVQEVTEPNIELHIDSIDAAFVRGAMHLEASFIRCVGYNRALYDMLVSKGHVNLNDEKRPTNLATSSMKRKRGGPGTKVGRAKAEAKSSDSEWEVEEESGDEDFLSRRSREFEQPTSEEDLVEVTPRKKVKRRLSDEDEELL